MTQPLALVFYEKMLPGSQLVNRLQDLGYRVTTVGRESIADCAAREKPMVVLADLSARNTKVPEAIAQLRQSPATSHLPVLAFADDKNLALHSAARDAGATLVVGDAALLTHLPHFLDQALQLD